MRNLNPEQHDTGTRLATPSRRRPFSECNKGNRRRLHAGYRETNTVFRDTTNSLRETFRETNDPRDGNRNLGYEN